jgi:hypothetical protein
LKTHGYSGLLLRCGDSGDRCREAAHGCQAASSNVYQHAIAKNLPITAIDDFLDAARDVWREGTGIKQADCGAVSQNLDAPTLDGSDNLEYGGWSQNLNRTASIKKSCMTILSE